MSTVRVLVLAHHHGNWRVVGVDKLHLGNAARVGQLRSLAGERYITTKSQHGTTLVCSSLATEMGLLSHFTGNAKPVNPSELAALETNNSRDLALTIPKPLIPPHSATRHRPKIDQDRQTLRLKSGLAGEGKLCNKNGQVPRRDPFKRPKGVKVIGLLSPSPTLSLQEVFDSDHVVPNPASGVPHADTFRPKTNSASVTSSLPSSTSQPVDKYPSLQNLELEQAARKKAKGEQELLETAVQVAEVDRKVKVLTERTQEVAEQVQKIPEIDRLLAELDELIQKVKQATDEHIASRNATAALLLNMEADEEEMFRQFRKDSAESADVNQLAMTQGFAENERPRLDLESKDAELEPVREPAVESAAALSLKTTNQCNISRSRSKKGVRKSKLPVLSPPGVKQVHVFRDQEIEEEPRSPEPAVSRLRSPVLGVSMRRSSTQPASSRKDVDQTLSPVDTGMTSRKLLDKTVPQRRSSRRVVSN